MQPLICKLESDTQVDVRCCSPCEGLQLLLAQRCQLQQLLLLVHCHSLLEPSQDALQTRSTSLSNITTATWPHVPGMHVPLETGLWLLEVICRVCTQAGLRPGPTFRCASMTIQFKQGNASASLALAPFFIYPRMQWSKRVTTVNNCDLAVAVLARAQPLLHANVHVVDYSLLTSTTRADACFTLIRTAGQSVPTFRDHDESTRRASL